LIENLSVTANLIYTIACNARVGNGHDFVSLRTGSLVEAFAMKSKPKIFLAFLSKLLCFSFIL
jgi:hypothetical protein